MKELDVRPCARKCPTYAPRMITMKINPEKIRDVIGKGGAVIRALTEETGCVIDIEDDGTITIACGQCRSRRRWPRSASRTSRPKSKSARSTKAPCCRLLDFGAIVSVLPGKDGLLHISQIANERVNAVADHLKEGQVVKVKVLETDDKGRMRLSMKAAGRGSRRRRCRVITAVCRATKKDAAASFFVCQAIAARLRYAERYRDYFATCFSRTLLERLAVDAQRRRRARFQALQADLDAAAVAVAVVAGVDEGDRFVDLLDQLALAIAVAQFERDIGFLAGAIVRDRQRPWLRPASCARCARYRPINSLLSVSRMLAEVRELLGVHVLLALLGDVGRELLVQNIFGHLAAVSV